MIAQTVQVTASPAYPMGMIRPLQPGQKSRRPSSLDPRRKAEPPGSLPEVACRQAQAGVRERSARLAESNKNSAFKAKK